MKILKDKKERARGQGEREREINKLIKEEKKLQGYPWDKPSKAFNKNGICLSIASESLPENKSYEFIPKLNKKI